MSAALPTPGPWHVGQGNGEGSVFCGEGYRMRCEGGTVLYPICTVTRGWEESEDEANAHLIAAAPDLYTMLARLTHALRTSIADGQMSPYFCLLDLEQAQAALDKAVGR